MSLTRARCSRISATVRSGLAAATSRMFSGSAVSAHRPLEPAQAVAAGLEDGALALDVWGGERAPRDRAALGLSVYAGLRLGEMLALEWSAIDLEAGTLRVERAWDHGARQFVAPKSKAGRRTVPIIGRLALLLGDHRVLTNQADGLLFPGRRDPARPVSHNALRDRAASAWKDAELEALGFHEARHTFASLMIAAGVNAKALSTYMGHAHHRDHLDRYGHLMPGNEAEAAGLLDAYLERDV